MAAAALVVRVVVLALWLAWITYWDAETLDVLTLSTSFLLGVAVARWWALAAPPVGVGVLVVVGLVSGETIGEFGLVRGAVALLAMGLVVSIPLALGVAVGRWLFGDRDGTARVAKR